MSFCRNCLRSCLPDSSRGSNAMVEVNGSSIVPQGAYLPNWTIRWKSGKKLSDRRANIVNRESERCAFAAKGESAAYRKRGSNKTFALFFANEIAKVELETQWIIARFLSKLFARGSSRSNWLISSSSFQFFSRLNRSVNRSIPISTSGKSKFKLSPESSSICPNLHYFRVSFVIPDIRRRLFPLIDQSTKLQLGVRVI